MLRSFKATMATILVPGSFCFLLPYFIIKASLPSLSPLPIVAQILAGLLVLCGLGMVVWVSIAFVRKGQGTPIPLEPPKHLVIQGLFRYVRNPMYVGALLILLVEALLFRSAWLLLYAAGLWCALHLFLVIIEEPQLQKRFGSDFLHYMQTVPRWIPRVRRGKSRTQPPKGDGHE
jgi:protein-S-isoprenylcysteine O-methyltransferase Ste14